MVWARSSTGAKLVGSTGQGRCPGRLRRRLSLKGRVKVCVVYVFPLIFYCLSVLPLSKNHRLALQRSLSKSFWRSPRAMVRKKDCCQHPRNGGLCMPDLENHWLAERLVHFGRSLSNDLVGRRKASISFPRLKSDPKAEGQRKLRDEAPFVCECRKSLLQPSWVQ